MVGGGQIGDVEQKGEEELRKEREKRGSSWGDAIWAVGATRSGLALAWLGDWSLASDCGWS